MKAGSHVEKQRAVVAELDPAVRTTHQSALLLQTLEKTQALLEEHLKILRRRFEQKKL